MTRNETNQPEVREKPVHNEPINIRDSYSE